MINVETETLGKANKFIVGLEQEERDTALAMIKLLQKPPYEAGLIKIVDKGSRIYEVRGSTKNFWIRLFWFYHKVPQEGKSVIVVTNGCVKKQNRTTLNEIAIAKRIQSLYETQKQEECTEQKKRKSKK